MSETTVNSLIAAIGTVLVALVGSNLFVANRTRQHARAASDHASEAVNQTKNHHEENLRDDLDGKHDATLEALAEFRLEYQQDQLAVFTELRALASDDRGQRRRITDLENTQGNAPSIFEPPRKGKHA